MSICDDAKNTKVCSSLTLKQKITTSSYTSIFVVQFVSGDAAVKVTVLKDGHQFVVHIVDPKDDPFAEEEPILDENTPSGTDVQSHSEKEKAEVESSEKEGQLLSRIVDFD